MKRSALAKIGWASLGAALLLCLPQPSPAATETSDQSVADAKDQNIADGKDRSIADSKDTIRTEDGSVTEGTGKFARFPFHVSVGVRGGYDDNVYSTSRDEKGSGFAGASLGLTYDFGSPRTRLSLSSGAGFSYYFDRPVGRSYDVNSFLSFNITHRATPRLTLLATTYAAYQSEPNFAFSLSTNRRSGDFFFTSNRFSVAYQITPRLSSVTSYSLGIVQYEDSAIGTFEDRFENTFGEEIKYLFLPTTAAVAEYRFGIVTYDNFPRDSTTHFLLAGVDHSFSPRLSASVRGGVEFRSYEDNGDRTSPYFEGTLKYALGSRSSVSWTNRYSIEEPDVPGSPSRRTFRTGLQVSYAVTPRITATLGAYYEHDDNEGGIVGNDSSPSFSEDSFDLALAVRYAITRNLAVELAYSHIEVTSDIDLREYSRNRYSAGVNFSF